MKRIQPCLGEPFPAKVLPETFVLVNTRSGNMGRLGSFVFGVVVGAGLVFGSLKYHAVRAVDGVHVVPKISASFEDAYVDIRQFGPTDWDHHRTLAAALVKADKEGLIVDSATESLRTSLRSALDGITGSGS
jgi:hypothetical protein